MYIYLSSYVGVGKLHTEVVAVIAGGDVHVQSGVNGSLAIVGAVPPIICAFTSTGIEAPVFSPNS